MKSLIDDIIMYEPVDEKECAEKDLILSFLQNAPDPLDRTNLTGHMTVSAWVVNPRRTKVLMAYHKIYDSWAWLGGHADGCADLAAVAVKEACEEAGLTRENVRLVSRKPLSLEILTVSGGKVGAVSPALQCDLYAGGFGECGAYRQCRGKCRGGLVHL